MTFQEAEKKLKEIAGDQYMSLSFEKTTYGDGKTETLCRIYTDDDTWRSGPTWADAFRAREIGSLNPPVEETPGI